MATSWDEWFNLMIQIPEAYVLVGMNYGRKTTEQTVKLTPIILKWFMDWQPQQQKVFVLFVLQLTLSALNFDYFAPHGGV